MNLKKGRLDCLCISLLLWVVEWQVLTEGLLLVSAFYGFHMFQGTAVSRTAGLPPVSGFYLSLQAKFTVSLVNSSTPVVVESPSPLSSAVRQRGHLLCGQGFPFPRSEVVTLLFRGTPPPSTAFTFSPSLEASCSTPFHTIPASSEPGVYATLSTVSAGLNQAILAMSFFLLLAVPSQAQGRYDCVAGS